jgi:hypothetical protein
MELMSATMEIWHFYSACVTSDSVSWWPGKFDIVPLLSETVSNGPRNPRESKHKTHHASKKEHVFPFGWYKTAIWYCRSFDIVTHQSGNINKLARSDKICCGKMSILFSCENIPKLRFKFRLKYYLSWC